MQIKDEVNQEINALEQEVVALAKSIYEHPEISYQEHYASDRQIAYLREKGFAVESGIAGLPTAFKAIWYGSQNAADIREIAFLSEYDALPELGHACGHHLIAGAAICGAVALKTVMKKNGISGTVALYGTPAEENGGGKIALKEAGYFDNVLVCLMFHPYGQSIASPRALSNGSSIVEFTGKSSHAGSYPENGRSALTAALNLLNNIDSIRMSFPADFRIHGVIENGGIVENIIPDYVKTVFTLRAADSAGMQVLRKRFDQCIEAAALVTQTNYKVTDKFIFKNLIDYRGLLELFMANIQALGEDIVYYDEKSGCVSTDAGTLSHYMPLIHPMISIVENGKTCMLHTEEFARIGDTPFAYKKMTMTGKALAMTGLDVLLHGMP